MKKFMYGVSMAFALTLLTGSYTKAEAQTETRAKRGWSKKAKGAAIGGAAGAATGAAVSNKRGKGAVIGGAVGAGAGYIYGKKRAKKKGE